MLSFVTYWYVQSWNRFYQSFLGVVAAVEDQVGVVDTVHNLDKPLFQDYTRQGRVVGFALRLGRIAIGLLTFALVSIAYLGGYVFWLLFPLLCLVSITGSLLGPQTLALP